jgi:EAL domain-containing protein (putative c-di-GMP-specific phosphodiesterase class I)
VRGEEGDGPTVEVLVRMKDASGQEMAGCELVRAAERYKLMGRIDRWVVHNTLAAVAHGTLVLPAGRCVAINISAETLGDAQFLDFVVECLDRSGVEAEQVCFELSESAALSHPDMARRFVSVLHGMGCQFALDDFGAGSGSFSSLRSLPLNYVKIDGSLMRNLAGDPVNQTLVSSLIKLARSLSFKVIAEQVEDGTVLELARSMGVDYVQGYAIGHPVPLPLPPAAVVARDPRGEGRTILEDLDAASPGAEATAPTTQKGQPDQ